LSENAIEEYEWDLITPVAAKGIYVLTNVIIDYSQLKYLQMNENFIMIQMIRETVFVRVGSFSSISSIYWH
jgi:hypothetical protein